MGIRAGDGDKWQQSGTSHRKVDSDNPIQPQNQWHTPDNREASGRGGGGAERQVFASGSGGGGGGDSSFLADDDDDLFAAVDLDGIVNQHLGGSNGSGAKNQFATGGLMPHAQDARQRVGESEKVRALGCGNETKRERASLLSARTAHTRPW